MRMRMTMRRISIQKLSGSLKIFAQSIWPSATPVKIGGHAAS
jgi:hypothetical protein